MGKEFDIQSVATSLQSGNRRALARAITLIESTRRADRAQAQALLAELPQDPHTLRIGLSGTPGVGKSTFIEAFGMHLIAQGLKVAVLAVDPSSARSGGSILGDKTRMDELSRHPNAFIRPSPSQSQMGGVARRTRDATMLCAAAGYDVVLIETVGVGQSETMVAELSDIFLLLLAPAGGDELQGVKRGIMEMADLILVNKADGDLLPAATRTCADYAGALRLLRARAQDPDEFPKAMMVSALAGKGLEDTWAELQTLAHWRKSHGIWEATRRQQMDYWFRTEIRESLIEALDAHSDARQAFQVQAALVADGKTQPTVAAEAVVGAFLGQVK